MAALLLVTASPLAVRALAQAPPPAPGAAPPVIEEIELGSIAVQAPRITYGDMRIFEHWHLTKEPVLLIGMDVIGLLNVLIIDYARHEIEVRLRSN